MNPLDKVLLAAVILFTVLAYGALAWTVYDSRAFRWDDVPVRHVAMRGR